MPTLEDESRRPIESTAINLLFLLLRQGEDFESIDSEAIGRTGRKLNSIEADSFCSATNDSQLIKIEAKALVSTWVTKSGLTRRMKHARSISEARCG